MSGILKTVVKATMEIAACKNELNLSICVYMYKHIYIHKAGSKNGKWHSPSLASVHMWADTQGRNLKLAQTIDHLDL